MVHQWQHNLSSIASAEEQIKFLENIQSVLADGSFTTTYKYALLHSIADLAVQNDWSRPECQISISAIAERFIELYWAQVRIHPALDAPPDQGGKARIVQLLSQFADQSIHTFRADSKSWQIVSKEVRQLIYKYPLKLLQTIGGSSSEFLYHIVDARTIKLERGAAYCLARFHGLITAMVRTEWYRMVQRLNPALNIGESDLHSFLFESQRRNLEPYRGVLFDFQEGRCFYCDRLLNREGSSAAVDHFIPWVRYPWDVGHNFVLADKNCNSSKSDLLPAGPHVKRWASRYRNPAQYEHLLQEYNLPSGKSAVLRVVQWAYLGAATRSEALWQLPGKKGPIADIALLSMLQ